MKSFCSLSLAFALLQLVEHVTSSTTIASDHIERVKPMRYELSIKPSPYIFTSTAGLAESDFTYLGHVEITVSIETVSKEQRELTIKLDRELGAGAKCLLSIDFSGAIGDELTGFYRSVYKTRDGMKHYLLSTQFEPAYASTVFPCWDDPAAKAVFSVSLELPEGVNCISNMPSRSADVPDGGKRFTFQDTPPMSPHVLAWAIGHIEALGNAEVTRDGTVIQVFSIKGTEPEYGRFAANVAAKALEYLGEYTGVKYPLPRVSLVAIPNMGPSVLASFGLALFRPQYLLFNPIAALTKSKPEIAALVAHSTAYQWPADDRNQQPLCDKKPTGIEILAVESELATWRGRSRVNG